MSVGRCTVIVFEHLFDHPAPGWATSTPVRPGPDPPGSTDVRDVGERHATLRRPGRDPDGSGVGDGGSRAVPVAGPVVEGPGGPGALGRDRPVVAVRWGAGGDRLRRAGRRPSVEPVETTGRRPARRA